MTVFFWFFVSLALALIALLFWLKWWMAVSKARFAFASLSAMVSCLFAALTAGSVGLPILLASKISLFVGLGELSAGSEKFANVVVPLLTIATIFFIYRFASKAIVNWEAPARVSELSLAENYLQNNVWLLAAEQFKLFAKRQADPIASDYASNWEMNLTEAPRPVEGKDLLRDLLTTCVREITISDVGWRDESNLWVGEVYGRVSNKTSPLIALVFDKSPLEQEIIDRLEEIVPDLNADANTKIFGLYASEAGVLDVSGIRNVSGVEIEILSSRLMIFKGLDLRGYAREILRTFRTTQVGGTDVTLENSYVELNVEPREGAAPSRDLTDMLRDWEKEKSKRHIVITGEYGQGKSTALLKYCTDWAERFLNDNEIVERVPLLIELRGRNPSESDPLAFLSTWCSRYKLLPEQVMNLIQSGDAIVIFEGFDELRNSGRAFDRHQHFNALWRFAYPRTKIVFTGRPNFFLDEKEINRTLRSDDSRTATGAAYTVLWRLQKLDKDQIEESCRNYDQKIAAGILNAINENSDFFDIVARPSMLPVVATIWSEIEDLQKTGAPLTGAILIERYLRAVYARKEAELEEDKVKFDAPSGSRYLVLPRPVRELLTICVAWRMSGLRGKNTISRSEINSLVAEIHDTLFSIAKSRDVSPVVVDGLLEFEQRHSETSLADKIDVISTEICSAGLLVPDPAGGATNLRFPHKQFYEFLIAKAACIVKSQKSKNSASLIVKSSSQKGIFSRLESESNSVQYLAECNGPFISPLYTVNDRLFLRVILVQIIIARLYIAKASRVTEFCSSLFRKNNNKETYNKPVKLLLDKIDNTDYYMLSSGSVFITILGMVASVLTSIMISFSKSENSDKMYFIGDWSASPFYIVALVLLFASVLLSTYIFSSKRLAVKVLLMFLDNQWKLVNQRPENYGERLVLAVKTVKYGRIQFPEHDIEFSTDFDQFLDPSQEFES